MMHHVAPKRVPTLNRLAYAPQNVRSIEEEGLRRAQQHHASDATAVCRVQRGTLAG